VLEKYFRGRGAAGSAGTGMGLPIAREIAEAHGGRLWFESRQGGGAEFSLALPAAAERGQP
jgi:signal transduction histidine kinase